MVPFSTKIDAAEKNYAKGFEKQDHSIKRFFE